MTAFVDTSALVALLDRNDARHDDCARAWRQLLQDDARLTTSNYVVVESSALAQRRLGMEAVRSLTVDFLPLLAIEWIDEPAHSAGHSAMLIADRRKLSLVDCVSFELMRRRNIRHALALDADFAEQGFTVVP